MFKRRVGMLLVPISLGIGLASTGRGGAQSVTAPNPLPSAVAVRLPLFKAYSQGKVVYYTNFEASDAAFARSIRGAFAPRLAKAKDDGTDEFFLITNGATGQVPVLGSPPGDPDYSPIWHLHRVTWKSGAKKTLLTSEADIDAQAANLTETDASIFFNCPVIMVSDDAQGTNLRVAPTLVLGPQVIQWSVTRGARTGSALYVVEPVWHDGRLYAMLSLEGAAAGHDPLLPAVAPVPKLSLSKIANGVANPQDSAVADLWVTDNGLVLDSIPDTADQDKYSPVWAVHVVSFNEGKVQRPLRSDPEIAAAATAGDVTIIMPGPNNGADAVFNCPVIDARATTPLPSAANEIAFLVRAGLLAPADAATLSNDLRQRNSEQYFMDVASLVGASKLTPAVGQLLLALPH
jgi:hypothetical protein